MFFMYRTFYKCWGKIKYFLACFKLYKEENEVNEMSMPVKRACVLFCGMYYKRTQPCFNYMGVLRPCLC